MSVEQYLTLQQAANRARLSRKTLYKWIYQGRLNEKRGLRRLGTRRLIDWDAFNAAAARGEFAERGQARKRAAA